MKYQIENIIEEISVSQEKIWIKSNIKESKLLVDYLNSLPDIMLNSKQTFYDEQRILFSKVKIFNELVTEDDKWNYFENHFGGNALKPNTNKFGWLSLQNYIPNVVINRKTLICQFDFLLDTELSPSLKLEFENLVQLIEGYQLLNFELTKKSITNEIEDFLFVILSNWQDIDELQKYATLKVGYVDSNNGFGVVYKNEIDFETTIEVPENHILLFAENISNKEFTISENDYLLLLIKYLKKKTTKKITLRIKQMNVNKTTYNTVYSK